MVQRFSSFFDVLIYSPKGKNKFKVNFLRNKPLERIDSGTSNVSVRSSADDYVGKASIEILIRYNLEKLII